MVNTPYKHTKFLMLAFFITVVTGPYSSAHDDPSDTQASLHFSHPLIAESPSPDTKVRLDYFFLNVDGEVQDDVV